MKEQLATIQTGHPETPRRLMEINFGLLEADAVNLRPISAGRRDAFFRQVTDFEPHTKGFKPAQKESYYKLLMVSVLFHSYAPGPIADPFTGAMREGAGKEHLLVDMYKQSRQVSYDKTGKHARVSALGTQRALVPTEHVHKDEFGMFYPNTEKHFMDLDMAAHIQASQEEHRWKPQPSIVLPKINKFLMSPSDVSIPISAVDVIIPDNHLTYDTFHVPINDTKIGFAERRGIYAERLMSDTVLYTENDDEIGRPGAQSALDNMLRTMLGPLCVPDVLDPDARHRAVIQSVIDEWNEEAKRRKDPNHVPKNNKEFGIILGEPALLRFYTGLKHMYMKIEGMYDSALTELQDEVGDYGMTPDQAILAEQFEEKALLRETFDDVLLWTGLSIRRAHEKAGTPFKRLPAPASFLEHMEERESKPRFRAQAYVDAAAKKPMVYNPEELVRTFSLDSDAQNIPVLRNIEDIIANQ